MAGALQLRVARTFWQRFLGVRAWDDWEARSWALWLPRCRAVHTFALGYPIDVVFVSRDRRPLRVVHSLRAGRTCMHLPAWGVLELPAGYCSESGASSALSAVCGVLKIEV